MLASGDRARRVVTNKPVYLDLAFMYMLLLLSFYLANIKIYRDCLQPQKKRIDTIRKATFFGEVLQNR